jgi:HlyD family secretion protein
MTIFLPAADAGKLEIGGEARIILDAVPDYVIPATISFVAADAQFTPKTVETKDERAKLMFRIKLKINPDVLQKYYSRVKTGIRGMGFVRTDVATAWPTDLQIKLPEAKTPESKPADAAAPGTASDVKPDNSATPAAKAPEAK